MDYLALPLETDSLRKMLTAKTTDELKKELVELLGLTAQNLLRLAIVVSILEDRGESLAALKSGFVQILRKIASGKLLPEIVVLYAGEPEKILKACSMPIQHQADVVKGKAAIPDRRAERTYTPRTIRVSECIEDMNIYPRLFVDEATVSRLEDSLRAGEELEPVIVCASSKRLVDGLCRRRAYANVNGPTATMAAEYRTYATDAELFLDAVRTNAKYGKPFTDSDCLQIAARAKGFGIERIATAAALCLTVERLAELETPKPSAINARPNSRSHLSKAGSRPKINLNDDADDDSENSDAIMTVAAMNELLRRKAIPDIPFFRPKMAEMFDLLQAWLNGADGTVQMRYRIGKLLLAKALPVAEICRLMGAQRPAIEAVLRHAWFSTDGTRWLLTVAGRSELG